MEPQSRDKRRTVRKALWGTRRRRITTVAAAALLSTTAVVAAILLIQSVSVSTTSMDSDVQFELGNDYTAISTAGYASATIGSSGASVTLTLNGVAGASDLQMVDLLKINNTDATQAYTVTMTRSAAPPAAITSLEFILLDSGDSVIRSYDAVAAASATSFTLPTSTIYDIRVDMVVADGTAAGSLGSFTLSFELVPV